MAGTPVTTVVRAVDRSKETPQERLKRLMAAQLNKKIQKDNLTAAQVWAAWLGRRGVGRGCGGTCWVMRRAGGRLEWGLVHILIEREG